MLLTGIRREEREGEDGEGEEEERRGGWRGEGGGRRGKSEE